MKRLSYLSLAVFGTVLATSAQAQNIVEGSYIHAALTEICSEAKQDDRLGLHKTLRSYRISRQNAVDKVMCNQQQLVPFARTNQAFKVVNMLERYEKAPERKVTITDITPSAN